MTIYFEEDSTGCDLVASFTYTIVGDDILFTNTSTGEPSSPTYAWTIDGLSSTDENPTFSTTGFESEEEVCLTVTGGGGDSSEVCTDTYCMTIYFDSLASVASYNMADVEIFPNPVNVVLNVKINNANSNQNIIIYNTIGEIVRTDRVGVKETAFIDVSTLPQGLYIIHIIDEENPSQVIQEKFIKE